MSVERPCEHCDSPDSALLRVVLIGEIIRADDTMLYTLAEVFEDVGMLQLSETGDNPTPDIAGKEGKNFLHRVK